MADEKQSDADPRSAAVIVAHPDDETLWAGGAILTRPRSDWFVTTLCRGSDADRAPRFARVMEYLHAQGSMADLDDGAEQMPLSPDAVQAAMLACLPPRGLDLVLTHGPGGEYTRHRRHEEVCRAVVALWEAGKLTARQMWMFAYEDGGKRYLPRPRPDAHFRISLPESVWQEKYRLVTEIYGFAPDSWEARTTPRVEAFWCFDSHQRARQWVDGWGLQP